MSKKSQMAAMKYLADRKPKTRRVKFKKDKVVLEELVLDQYGKHSFWLPTWSVSLQKDS